MKFILKWIQLPSCEIYIYVVINHSLRLYIYIVKLLNLKIPPNVRPVDILGEKKANLQRIERTTNIHMYYNEDEAVSIISTCEFILCGRFRY
jgi:hypothetical protein